jgi:hypothetical protein
MGQVKEERMKARQVFPGMKGLRTVFMVEWWAPGAKYADGDMAVEEVMTEICELKNWSRGFHYRDYFMDAEIAYKYAESIKEELGIKAIIGSYESYQKSREKRREHLLEEEEIEAQRRNRMCGRPGSRKRPRIRPETKDRRGEARDGAGEPAGPGGPGRDVRRRGWRKRYRLGRFYMNLCILHVV